MTYSALRPTTKLAMVCHEQYVGSQPGPVAHHRHRQRPHLGWHRKNFDGITYRAHQQTAHTIGFVPSSKQRVSPLSV